MKRDEWSVRCRELVKRGQELPHAKLHDLDVITIRSAARQRESLRAHIRAELSNEALARKFGVHIRTIEKVVQSDSWVHL